MKNCSDTKDVLSVQKVYPTIQIGCYQEEFLGTIHVFTLLFDTVVSLKESWMDVYSTVAAYYQTNLPLASEFERWNIYLLYICKEEVDKETQYKIENDRFASRKIIIGNFNLALSDKVVKAIIDEHITNADLEIGGAVKHKSETFQKDVLIDDIVNRNKPAGAKKDSDIDVNKILAELEKKFTDEI